MKDKIVRIFISCAKQDEDYLKDLKRHLEPLVKERMCEVYTDEKMAPGKTWDKSTTDAFERSHIILFLVSADFVSSWYHTGEMQHAIERYRRGQAMIIPIIVRPADWQSLPINRYNSLPKDGIPISSWEERYGDSLIRTSLSKDTAKDTDYVWSVEVIQPLKELISKILSGDIQLTEPLKKASSKPAENSAALMALKDKARKLIVEANLTEASEVVQEMIVALDTPKAVNGPLLEDMVILRSQHNQLQKQYRMGLISFDDYSRAANRINFALLETLDRLKISPTQISAP